MARPDDTGARVLGRTAIAAVLLHAGVLAVAARVHPAPSPQLSPAAASVQIDLIDSVPARADGTPPPAAEGLAATAGTALARLRTSRSVTPHTDEAPAPTPDPGERVEPSPAPGSPAEAEREPAPDGLSLEQLGVAGRNPLFEQRAHGRLSEREKAEKRLRASVEDPLYARDKRIGLGASGPVVAALERAAYAGAASPGGRAVFEATADGTGKLLGLTLVETNGEWAAWQRVADAARAGLGRARLRVPRDRKVSMRIELTLEWKLPSGNDPSTEVTLFKVPLKKGKGKRPIRVDLFGPFVVLTPDPTDFTPRPRAIVHARVLDERPL